VTESVDDTGSPVRAVSRSLDVLDALRPSPLSLSELARETRLSKGTVHRLLSALAHQGYVMQDPVSGSYMLGPALLKIANIALEAFSGVGVIARPAMTQLWRESGETITLHVRLGYERICLAEIPSSHPMRFISGVGESVPIHSGSAGKVLLAFADPETQELLIRRTPLKMITKATITDPVVLERELHEVRMAGWAVSWGERIAGAVGISAPIFDATGTILASLSVLGPEQRVSQQLDASRKLHVEATTALSGELANPPGSNR
jgi:DNA-binding IclR family transcriptional regulator